MNIHELSSKTGISLTVLRKLEREGALKIDGKPENEGHPRAGEIRFHLCRNQQLTVSQILVLIDEPDVIDELRKYSDRARAQLDALGDVQESLAPKDVTASIPEASRGERDACLTIAAWLQSVLPADGRTVSYYWVAVRLLAPLNTTLRETYQPIINLALLKVRQLPEMSGWHSSMKEKTRNATIFHRSVAIPLAQHDL